MCLLCSLVFSYFTIKMVTESKIFPTPSFLFVSVSTSKFTFDFLCQLILHWFFLNICTFYVPNVIVCFCSLSRSTVFWSIRGVCYVSIIHIFISIFPKFRGVSRFSTLQVFLLDSRAQYSVLISSSDFRTIGYLYIFWSFSVFFARCYSWMTPPYLPLKWWGRRLLTGLSELYLLTNMFIIKDLFY